MDRWWTGNYQVSVIWALNCIFSSYPCSRISGLEVDVETLDSQFRLHEEDFGVCKPV